MEDTRATVDRTEAGLPAPGTWVIDSAHTSVGFVARYLMVTRVRGHFPAFEGNIEIAEAPEDSRVEVTIDAASVDTRNEGRDQHLRSPDFLDVERYPQLTFRSTKVERTGPSSLAVEGDLTIRDVTKPVTLDVEFEGTGADPWGKTRVAFSARGQIDREGWGITWNQALEAGGVLVGRKVDIELEVQAVQSAADEQMP